MKVRKKQLLLAAGIIWGFAGINILRIGILAYRQNWSVRNALISLAVFAVFRAMVFGKLVKKHTARIMNYTEEKQFILKFFDVKSFCIMAFMMSFGIGIRMSGIWPDSWIAVYRIGDSFVSCRNRLYQPLYKGSQSGTAISGSGNVRRRRRQCRQ